MKKLFSGNTIHVQASELSQIFSPHTETLVCFVIFIAFMMQSTKTDPNIAQMFATYMSESQQCVQCDFVYTLKSDVGRWECTYHPLPLNVSYQGHGLGKFKCCGRYPRLMSHHPKYKIDLCNGCMRCDHFSLHSHIEPDIVAEIALLKEFIELELNPINKALLEDPCNPKNYLIL